MKNLNHISRMKSLISISVLLLLTACSSVNLSKKGGEYSSSSSGFDPLRLGQSRQQTEFDSDAKLKASNFKTIAVTDIAYSREFRDSFTSEENILKRTETPDGGDSSGIVIKPFKLLPPKEPSLRDDEIKEQPTSTYRQKPEFDDKSVYMHNVGFMKIQATLDDLIKPPRALLPPGMSAGIASRGDISNQVNSETISGKNFEHSYTKKSGTESKMTYGELRGLTGSIKGMLLKSGYRVVQGKPNVARANQNDEFFDIAKRIDAGDFDGADYVLYGVLTSMSQNTHSAPIQGSTSQMAINEFEITVDFSLIDTRTRQVVSSFVATGSASDNRIDGVAEGYKPSMPRMFKQMSTSLADSVAYNLANQDYVTSELVLSGKGAREIPGTEKYKIEERNLKIYK